MKLEQIYDLLVDGSQNLNIDDKKVIISRILERGVGSFFKINNKDVRAKDVSVLFYDSGSGPRSSSIITQGNIDQVINYKPIERKIILEDAAGISGLQARRRESELKLQSTDINLEKVQINLDNLFDQKKNLSRQARQAERYESGQPKRNQCQFSWYCDGKKDIPTDDTAWEKSRKYASDFYIYSKYIGITEGATHYHAP